MAWRGLRTRGRWKCPARPWLRFHRARPRSERMAGDPQTPRPAVPPRAAPLANLPEPEAGGAGALGPGDVAEMIAAQRRLVEKLSPCSGPDCAELTAHLRTLSLLEEELRRRMPPSPARA